MRNGLFSSVVILLGLSVFGCRIPGRFNPVTPELVNSRQICQLGIAAIERGEWDIAESRLAEAVASCPDNPDAHRYYAEALWHRGQQAAAVAELNVASKLAREDASLHVLAAEMRLAMGQRQLARAQAQYAIDLDPKLSPAWAIRARVRQADGQNRKALADYHRALGLAPDDQAIRLEIAQLYQHLNQPQQALATLHSLADSYSPGEEPPIVLYLQGLAYESLERYDDAAESLTAASLCENPSPEIFYRLARAHMFAGQPKAAAAAARDALALRPGHRPSHELLNQANLASGESGLTRR